jgi:polyhydroxyalkanoate synthesis repressor PhaR
VKSVKPTRGERVIRRYDNRKLYDAAARRYVTLDDLAQAIGKGEELRVVDQRTGDDLTTVVMAQVILEGLKQRTASIPHQVLSRLIRLANGPRNVWAEWTGPQEAATRARAEAEKIVSGLLGRGRLTLDEALALRQEMAGAVQRIVAEAQQGLEAKMRGLLERTGEAESGVSPSLSALRARLLSFESLIAPTPVRTRSQPARKSRTRGTAAKEKKTQKLKRRK